MTTAEHVAPAVREVELSSARAGAQGMDRRIERKKLSGTKLWLAGAAFVLFIGGYFIVTNLFTGRSLHIAGNRLIIAEATSGTFEDFIPVRARVAPLKTVFLDAVQGGRVEEIMVEDGATLEKDQVILKLSNSDLQLSVMSTESRVMEQLNVMRDQELRLEQNRLSHKRTLVDLDYNIRRLTREIARKKELLAKSYISRAEYDDFIDELNYYRKKRNVTLESQASDEKLMTSQLTFFKDKTANMEENLAFARKSLQDLTVRAPVAGRLSGFNVEIGQNIPRGDRIGQVSDPDAFKLAADIDEYYLDRVETGQQASFERNNREYKLRIVKIYPNVKNGQFEVDLKFINDSPDDLRRGLTIQSKLTLGDSNEALLIPNGQFFLDTGGQWVFALNSDGTEAYKQTVRLGRRNNRYIEVLEGLQPGEKVITSSYGGFKEIDRLKLDRD